MLDESNNDGEVENGRTSGQLLDSVGRALEASMTHLVAAHKQAKDKKSK